MSSKPSEEAPLTVTLQATPATPSPSLKAFDFDFSGTNYEMDASIPEEERRFYLKMYPSVDVVIQRKVHCTVCRAHIGTAPSAESNIKMHPILRVTHCIKCHEFYNSGEFSKGEDGSELYCRWCGQGGEVYCCSTCPFVFCKSCIIKNLSRGVIVDIEQNENWNCFRCTSKILWPLRAQHWALINYIETQKKGLQQMQLSETELRKQLQRDHSTCCRLAKAKTNSLSDSMESLESNASKRSHASSVPSARKSSKLQVQSAKRAKLSNDEVVCTPDLLSMLEPDCQISVPQKPAPRTQVQASTITTTPRIVTVQQNYSGPSPSPSSNGSLPAGPLNSLPPPLVLSSSGMRYRQTPPNNAIVRRTVVPNAIRSAGPVFHTINGFRVDLNSAAQQDSYRLPNGRLIQVKRQVPPNTHPSTNMTRSPVVLNPQVIIRQQTSPGPVPRIAHNSPSFGSNMGIFNPQTNQQQRAPHVVRVNNGSQIQSMNISVAPASTSTPVGSNGGTTIMMTPPPVAKVPTLVRHVFPPHGIGRARTQLQDQIFNAMEICTHLTGKVQSLTHSNAYNQARSYMDLKELYIHLSYLTTYAIGRFKQLQEKCLVDMREMGFKNDANSLENGQLAAAVDYVCYGQLDDVDLFNTGCNSFHNQVYEYRKSLQANLKDGQCIEPLPPLMPLGVRAEGDPKDDDDEQENNGENENDEHDVYDDEQDNDAGDADDADDGEDPDDLDDDYDALGTEESMNRNEQAHAYDRKLTRLLREYPSIWCTRHPDYGNMDVTRKQWRVIASHFSRGDDIKLRWKNIRKRYVRIERLLKQGKRFKGYFDKATNYLANRDLSRSEWKPIDCGEADGDGFERKQLDAIENSIHKDQDFVDKRQQQLPAFEGRGNPRLPVEVRPIDMRIINFAKSHPVLWRKSADPEFNSIDEQTRNSLWLNFWKSAPKKQASDDEDNEIEIVEPKTDTITIDSDNEEDTSSGSKATEHEGLKITSVQSTAEVPAPDLAKVDPVTANIDPNTDIDVAAFTSSILASLLEVDITEGPGIIAPKKQPRKKTTNKPNPALLHLERQRIQETKRNDAKLQMKLVVKLRRAEKDFEVARKWVEENARLRKSGSDAMANDEKQASDSVHEEPFEVIKNKSDNTNEDNIENNETKDKEKPCDAKVVEKIDNTDEIEKLKDKISVDSIDTLKANNEIKLSDNPEIVDNLEADGKETFAFKDLKADKTADKGLTPTVALLEKNSELEAMEVMEILETLGKMDVPELVKSLDAATNMKADFVDEAIKPQAATVLNYKNDTETDFSVNKDATSGDHGKIDTPEEIKSFPEKCAKDNIKTIERQNSEETGEGNDTSSAKDPEADKTSDIEKNIADSPTDNDLELQEAMEVMQSIESDVSMEVTDIIASLTSEMFEDEPVTEMEDTETYKTDANLQDASAGGEVSPSASVPAIDTTHLDNVDECNKFVDYSTATVPAEQAADDAVVAATGTTTTPELNKPADIDTPSISSQSKPILGCEQSNTQNIEMNSEDTSDHIREPESDTKDNAI